MQIGEIVTSLSEHISTEQQMSLLENLMFSLSFLPSQIVTESVDTIYFNDRWLATRLVSIKRWFEQRSPTVSPTPEPTASELPTEQEEATLDPSTTSETGGSSMPSGVGIQTALAVIALLYMNNY